MVALTGCAAWGKPRARLVARHRGLHDAFRAPEGCRQLTDRNTDSLPRAKAQNSVVEIAAQEQRGLLVVAGPWMRLSPIALGSHLGEVSGRPASHGSG